MLAARHRARLAMQEGDTPGVPTEARRERQRVARRLFQDDEQDQNHDRNNLDDSGSPYAGVKDNITNRLSEETRKNLDVAEKRWNFDFRNEKPLSGRYEWVKVKDRSNEEEDLFEEKIDQREKSETEASEKSEISGTRD